MLIVFSLHVVSDVWKSVFCQAGWLCSVCKYILCLSRVLSLNNDVSEQNNQAICNIVENCELYGKNQCLNASEMTQKRWATKGWKLLSICVTITPITLHMWQVFHTKANASFLFSATTFCVLRFRQNLLACTGLRCINVCFWRNHIYFAL